ncbi:MAG: hypothetical protein HUU21_24590 [Polyangiaceae bacterium]|nr:hypothetical protein [Polyangiaceae bacterium]NUQ76726.1 hypothetical protein [Polyangiaceae bacterium]
MRRRALLLLAALMTPLVAATVSSGCGPSVSAIPDDDFNTDKDAGNDAKKDATPLWDASKDAFDEYVDPGCPDAPPPIEDFSCDPYNQGNGDCGPGEGCYIYVDYPDEPCGQEVYGAFCIPAGTGTQGDSCTGAQACAAGYCCVVTGSGTQCVKLCPLEGNDDCPPGLVCEPIDVEGFGGCL